MSKRPHLDDIPEFQRLSEHEKTQYTNRIMRVYGSYSHPERAEKMRELYDQIVKEVKSGHRVH